MLRLLLTMLVGVMAIGATTVGTLAFFDDTEVSSGNNFQAGTLNLTYSLNGGPTVDDESPSTNDNVNFTSLVPGSSGTETWALANTGNIPGDLTLAVSTLTQSPGSDGNNDLAGKIDVVLSVGGTPVSAAGETLATLAAKSFPNAAVLGSPVNVTLDWSIDGPSVGNEIQGDQASFNLTFTLDQQ